MFHIFCSKSQGKVQNNTAPMKFLCWRPGGRKEKNEKWNQGLPPPCHPFLCYSALAAPMGLHRSSQAASVVKDLPANAGDTREASSIPGLGRSPEGGYGNPLQYSCLENLMDEGAWWAIVHRVAKGQTQQSMHKTRHGVSETPWGPAWPGVPTSNQVQLCALMGELGGYDPPGGLGDLATPSLSISTTGPPESNLSSFIEAHCG